MVKRIGDSPRVLYYLKIRFKANNSSVRIGALLKSRGNGGTSTCVAVPLNEWRFRISG